MSCFSFTAPLIPAEEEQAELDSLTVTEREDLQFDMYGKKEESDDGSSSHNNIDDDDGDETQPTASTPTRQACAAKNEKEEAALLANKIQNVKEILLDDDRLQLPPKDVRAYRHALAVAPDVVSADTDYAAFLGVEEDDPLRAARRVARYWQLRVEVFGPDRVHLPMTLKGAVAGETDVLSLGLAFVLSKPDRHGRPVFFLDRTRYTARVCSRESFARILFYILSSVATTTRTGSGTSSRRNEYVVIVNVKVSKQARLIARASLSHLYVVGRHSLTSFVRCMRVGFCGIKGV